MRRLASFVIVVAFSIGGPCVVTAQQPSLADVARKEAERRKTVTAPSRVYTNKDVEKTSPRATVSTVAASAPAARPDAQAPAEGGTPAASGQPAAPPPATAPEPAKDEAYWRTRVAETRERLQRSRLFAEALQSRINALTTDFVNRDDPYQRQQIAQQRQEATAELDRVTRDIETYTKELEDIEEEARRAGVPAGWVR